MDVVAVAIENRCCVFGRRPEPHSPNALEPGRDHLDVPLFEVM